MEAVCDIIPSCGATQVDITGGEPSLHPLLPRFIEAVRTHGTEVQLRTNFTGLLIAGNEKLPAFLADHEVQIVGSLPCYLEDNVDAQRGDGVYEQSIQCLHQLNELCYSRDSARTLTLVYNPAGADLPPSQADLEAEYRTELRERHGVSFTNLLAITDMPVGRFQTALIDSGDDERYASLLSHSFNPAAVPGLMCRHQVSVRWDGKLFDCDFNLALGRPVVGGVGDHISQFDPAAMSSRRIVTGEHCFGCTAGAGSSCGGALL